MVLFAENTNKTLRALSLYIKDEEFLINTVFLLFLGLKPFFAGILAHGVNHVVDAGDFREIVPGWISRTFRDVERLDDSVVDVHGETLDLPGPSLEHGPGCVNSTPKFSTITEFGSPMNVMFVPAIPCASPHASMTCVSLVQ